MFLDSHIECFGMDQVIREIYYDKEKNIGLCRKCRDRFMKDPVWKIRMWLLVRCKIECIRMDKRGKERDVWEKALKRIDKIEKKLEKTSEVKELYRKNKEEIENEVGFY